MQQNNSKSLVALKLDLNDPNHKVRMQAARELCRKSNIEAVDAIVSRLEQERIPAVRKVVSRALIKMDVVHVLVALSRSKIDFERNLSVQWLQKFGRRHRSEMLALLKGEEALSVDTLELIVSMSTDMFGNGGVEFVKLALEDSRAELVIAGARAARRMNMEEVMPIVENVFSQWCEKTEVEEIRHILSKLEINPEDMAELADFERRLIQSFNTATISEKPNTTSHNGERITTLTKPEGDERG